MGLRDSFAEKRKTANETEENKEYLFCKSVNADIMPLPAEFERLMPKNEIRIVLLKYQMAKMRRSALSSPEANQTYFNQIPAGTIEYNPTQCNPSHMQSFNSLSATPSWSGIANGNEKIVMSAVFSTYILYQG